MPSHAQTAEVYTNLRIRASKSFEENHKNSMLLRGLAGWQFQLTTYRLHDTVESIFRGESTLSTTTNWNGFDNLPWQ
ncbi:MAG: hypothetical protein H6510_01480 [Acidobacteria bacterium]|nr:hypothetical protein [Acidobacteriota bacterium]